MKFRHQNSLCRVRGVALTIAVLLCAPAAFTLAGVGGQVGDRSAIDTAPPPTDWKIPPTPARSPEESIRQMEIAAGFRIEIVAAEPLVQDPIAVTFDARGRLWVLEWPTYNWPLHDVMPELHKERAPPSRIVLLEDTTGDGRMDRRTVFAELEWPRGMQVVDDGVLVFALPEILFLRDTTGDGKADTREVVIGGLEIPANPHAAPSSPLLAMDNWIYGLQIGHRLRRQNGRWNVVAASRLAGQWGLSQDDYGRLFFSYNQDHLRGSLVPVQYASRNVNYDAASGTDERIGLDQEVWPHAITAGVNRRAHLRDDGRLQVFTANAAPSVYRATQFPDEFHGNVFLGDSAGRLIRRTVLSEVDGIITGRNAYDRREFLFSHDERFRPVFTTIGPEGALYVADMYRGIIEGHIFITTFLRNQFVNRRLYEPFHGMGRIYRIVYEGRAANDSPAIASRDVHRWVPHLGHVNGFWRDTAQRSIVAAHDRTVVAAVRSLALSAPDPRTRLHALWTLDGLGAVDGTLIRALIKDTSPPLRAAAIRVSDPMIVGDAGMRRTVLGATDDPDLNVRRQLLYSLGMVRTAEAEGAMLRLALRDVDQPFMAAALVSGLQGRESAVLSTIVGAPGWNADSPGKQRVVAALAAAIVNEGRADRIDDLLRLAGDEAAQPIWQRIAVLQGVKASRRADLTPLPAALARLGDAENADVRREAIAAIQRFSRTRPVSVGERPVPDAALAARIAAGRTGYAVCAGCHQADGRGLPGVAPPLVGSPSVTGSADILIDIVLGGRDVDPAFPSMSPLTGLPDDQLADILTYVRQAWGNAAPAIGADAVRARRPR